MEQKILQYQGFKFKRLGNTIKENVEKVKRTSSELKQNSGGSLVTNEPKQANISTQAQSELTRGEGKDLTALSDKSSDILNKVNEKVVNCFDVSFSAGNAVVEAATAKTSTIIFPISTTIPNCDIGTAQSTLVNDSLNIINPGPEGGLNETRSSIFSNSSDHLKNYKEIEKNEKLKIKKAKLSSYPRCETFNDEEVIDKLNKMSDRPHLIGQSLLREILQKEKLTLATHYKDQPEFLEYIDCVEEGLLKETSKIIEMRYKTKLSEEQSTKIFRKRENNKNSLYLREKCKLMNSIIQSSEKEIKEFETAHANLNENPKLKDLSQELQNTVNKFNVIPLDEDYLRSLDMISKANFDGIEKNHQEKLEKLYHCNDQLDQLGAKLEQLKLRQRQHFEKLSGKVVPKWVDLKDFDNKLHLY